MVQRDTDARCFWRVFRTLVFASVIDRLQGPPKAGTSSAVDALVCTFISFWNGSSRIRGTRGLWRELSCWWQLLLEHCGGQSQVPTQWTLQAIVAAVLGRVVPRLRRPTRRYLSASAGEQLTPAERPRPPDHGRTSCIEIAEFFHKNNAGESLRS